MIYDLLYLPTNYNSSALIKTINNKQQASIYMQWIYLNSDVTFISTSPPRPQSQHPSKLEFSLTSTSTPSILYNNIDIDTLGMIH